jgi:ribosome biogenesis GTPase
LYALEDLGWGPFFDQHIDTTEDLIPARVAEEQRGAYVLFCEHGALNAAVAGRLMHEADNREDYPAVGDWVLASVVAVEAKAVVRRILPRRTKLSRKAAGPGVAEQIIVANVDVVFVVSALDRDLNPRRIERYLSVIWESGARPVVVLNKADIAEDPDALVREIERSTIGADIIVTSAATEEGVTELRSQITRGKTAAFVGSSGVGKSSLVNRLIGRETQTVNGLNVYGKGSHTTTSREMLLVPGGGLIVDTPGLRELGFWDAEQGMSQAFADVESYFSGCAFNDCSHDSEPGCAVQGALRAGRLDRERWDSYRKLERERLFVEGKRDVSVRNAEREKWKKIAKQNRRRLKSFGR